VRILTQLRMFLKRFSEKLHPRWETSGGVSFIFLNVLHRTPKITRNFGWAAIYYRRGYGPGTPGSRFRIITML